MASSLEGVLAGIPGLGGYVASQAFGQKQDMGNLQQIMQMAQLQQQPLKNQLLQAQIEEHKQAPELKRLSIEQAASARKDALATRLYEIEARAQDRNATREQKDMLAKMADATRRELAQMGFDMRREMAANRPQPQVQPLVPIVGPDGKPRLVERKDAVGAMPAATGAKAEAVEAGKSEVDNAVVTLKSALDALNEGGGITSTDKGVLPNAARWASTTGPGQLLGTMGGTVNQKNRDVISQARPLLMRSIMQATGMSAKAMDSNAELKLWLSTATDPTKSYEANVEALNNIASKYGSGAFKEGKTGVPSFANEADALKAGVKGKVLIGGRPARID